MNRSAIITFALAFGLFVPAVAAVSAAPASAAEVRVVIGAPVLVLGGAPVVVDHEHDRDYRGRDYRRVAYVRHVDYDRHLEARAIRHDVRLVREIVQDVRYAPVAYDPACNR